MKRFSATFTNDARRNVSFNVRGICQFDVLNPCWDNRKNDVPGKHWSGDDIAACPACTAAASLAKATRSNSGMAVTLGDVRRSTP